MGNSHPCGADPAILGEWSATLTLGLLPACPSTGSNPGTQALVDGQLPDSTQAA